MRSWQLTLLVLGMALVGMFLIALLNHAIMEAVNA